MLYLCFTQHLIDFLLLHLGQFNIHIAKTSARSLKTQLN